MNTQLRIDSLTVSNFRCFESLSLDFYRDLTVLVARNGHGKTAILDAIKVALGTFTNSFPYSTTASLVASDAHVRPGNEPQYPVSVKAVVEMGEDSSYVTRELTKAKGRTTSSKAKDLTAFGEAVFKQTQNKTSDNPVNLPILAFYGTGRLWSEQKFLDKDDDKLSPLAESRFVGYDAAFSARSNYKFVKQWLMEAIRFMDDTQETQNTVQYMSVKAQLAAVKKSLDNFLVQEGWVGLHYNRFLKDLAVLRDTPHYDLPEDYVEEPRVALPVSSLSDGVRAVFAMVADIACRCAKLNRHLGEHACEETGGIVLIDEVDLFLHPSWQQRIVCDLQRTFPNIQFIVTTHSPQVVSSVPMECVRVIEDGEVLPADIQTQGVESQDILARIFGTSPAPKNDPYVQKLQEYAKMEAAGQADSEKGKVLYQELAQHFGEQYPPLQMIEIHRKFIAKRSKSDA